MALLSGRSTPDAGPRSARAHALSSGRSSPSSSRPQSRASQMSRNRPCSAARASQGWDVQDAAAATAEALLEHQREMPEVLANLLESGMDREFGSASGRPANAYAQQVWSEVQDALSKMHTTQMEELNTIINSRQKLVDEKLNRISDRLWELSTGSLNLDCSNLNLDLSPVTNECRQMSERVMQAVGEMQAVQTDLRSGVEAKLASFEEQVGKLSSQVQELRSDVQEGQESALVMRSQLQQLVDQPVVDLDPVVSTVSKCCHFVEEDFRLVATELSVIQRALHLDFVRLPGASKRGKTKNFTAKVANVSDRDDEDQSAGEMPTLSRNVSKNSVVAVAAMPAASCAPDSAPDTQGEPEVDVLFNSQSEPLATTYRNQTRHREVWIQTDRRSVCENSTQTDHEELAKSTHHESANKRKFQRPHAFKGFGQRNKERMKRESEVRKQAKQSMMREPYNVVNQYQTTGLCQQAARSHVFESVTSVVVMLNSCWIAVDIDNNDAALITDAEPIFLIVENVFCIYFFAEMCLRFGAFANKCNAFRDGWFVFDSALVLNMVVETWIVPLIVFSIDAKGFQNTLDLSALRALRMVKLLRLSRMTRLLRIVPELMVVVKALVYCARSMAVFLMLWLSIIYVFAVIFRQVSDDSEAGNFYFRSVPEAMLTLLLDGVFADYAPVLRKLMDLNVWLGLLLLSFILLGGITIMYMLMGVVFESLQTCMKIEKENITISYMASALRQTMTSLGYDVNSALSQKDFGILLAEPDFIHLLNSVHVDVVALVEMLSVVYEDMDLSAEDMTFEKVVDLVLSLRGRNSATVKDTTETVRTLKFIIQNNTATLCEQLREEFSQLHEEIEYLRDELEPAGFREEADDE
eukprot:TRINITY_DN33119_c0_g1_i1.p1 TRINITY_DN33119_c0_g1~~TRINITY_DN33119_c0_g1_i1.p1  ORF type:complete len:874 (-),score=164.84 TRINITY_DN33119_c0_g1_i1:35-2632(-)